MRKSISATDIVCNTVTALVNDGSTFSSGRLNLYDSDSTVITRLPLSSVAYRDSTDGTAIANLISDATAYRDATVALYDVSNRDLTAIWDGTVSTFGGNGDFQLASLTIYKDSTVGVTTGFYAVPR